MKKNYLIIILILILIVLAGMFFWDRYAPKNNTQPQNVEKKEIQVDENMKDSENNKTQEELKEESKQEVKSNEEPKQEVKSNEEPKQEVKEEPKQETKAEVKEEIKQENNQETTQEVKQETKSNEEPKQEVKNETPVEKEETKPTTNTINNKYVSYNGWLSIKNRQLVNQYGNTIVLKGISSHGIQWFGDLVTETNLKQLKEWGSNVFRIAMYTEQDGYIANNSLKYKVYEIVEIARKLDMYVIIDWHILYDNNPMNHLNEAKAFFDEVSKKYADVPNVIYEICNEPNGNVSWDNDIYPYATEVINVIRNNSKKAIIIVGTPTWSQDVDVAARKPLDDNLVMYALHFYAGSHREWLRNKAEEALKTIPIFVSEWGVSSDTGNYNIDFEETKKWLEFMNNHNLSWVNWSLTNKNESSAFLKENTSYVSNDNLSSSGAFIKDYLNS